MNLDNMKKKRFHFTNIIETTSLQINTCLKPMLKTSKQHP